MQIKFIHLDSRKVETTESFFSIGWLEARIASGQESNQHFDPIFTEGRSEEWKDAHWKDIRDNEMEYEEDVNQYITLTLAELANPDSLAMTNAYLADNINCDVGQMAVTLKHRSRKYFLYRINADFLLLNLGLFHPDGPVLGDAYFDKGGSYYFSAAASLKKMWGGRTGLSDVLEKLSNNFGRYVQILRTMKQSSDNYLSFHTKIPSSDFHKLEQTLTVEVRKRKNEGTA